MTTPLAEFNRARYAYKQALAEATHIRIKVWSIYSITLSRNGIPNWVFIDHYPSAADAKLNCPTDSYEDYLVVAEYLSAADMRYDAQGFRVADDTDRFDSRLTGNFELFPAQMQCGEPVTGHAHWIPCNTARAGGKAFALCPKPTDWVDAPEPPTGSNRVTIVWAE